MICFALRKMKEIEDTACSGWKLNGAFEELEVEDLYIKNVTETEVLGELMGFRVK